MHKTSKVKPKCSFFKQISEVDRSHHSSPHMTARIARHGAIPEHATVNFKSTISNPWYKTVAWALTVKLRWFKCQGTSLMLGQHWFRYWLVAARQQAITWANVDPNLCHHMASLSHNNFIDSEQSKWYVTNILWTLPISCICYHDL